MGEVDFEYQLLTFLLSVALGIIICVLYDVLRITHKHCDKNGLIIFVTDILFWIIAAFLTYILLLLRCMGSIRVFVLLGEAIGFLLFRQSASDILLTVAEFIIKIIKKIIFAVKIPLRICYKAAAKLLLAANIRCKIIVNWLKKHLKLRDYVLYNLFVKKHSKQKNTE